MQQSRFLNFTGNSYYANADGFLAKVENFFRPNNLATVNPQSQSGGAGAVGSIKGSNGAFMGAGIGGINPVKSSVSVDYTQYSCSQLAMIYSDLHDKVNTALTTKASVTTSSVVAGGGGAVGSIIPASTDIFGHPVAINNLIPTESLTSLQSELIACITAMYNKKCNCGVGNNPTR